jgi:hypothetical protein
MEQILIIYSNPGDTERLRLDIEHRVIDDVIEARNVPPGTIIRLHAARLLDIVNSLSEREYSLIQFSGHGSNQGIFIESGKETENSEFVTAKKLAELLTKSQPNLKAAIFLSCYSAESIRYLSKVAPYVISVSGSANDRMSIRFIRYFYSHYFKSYSIERSYFYAQLLSGLSPSIDRRALQSSEGRNLIPVVPTGDHIGDCFLVDISQIENKIEILHIDRDEFINTLARKIRVHHRIFDTSNQRVTLPIGQYFGVFSWVNATDFISCHDIFKVKPEVSEDACVVWASLLVNYNDKIILGYRLHSPNELTTKKDINMALRGFSAILRLLEIETYMKVLREHVSNQYKISKAIIRANLNMAESKRDEEDFQASVIYLETALSSLHDLVDALTEQLAEPS